MSPSLIFIAVVFCFYGSLWLIHFSIHLVRAKAVPEEDAVAPAVHENLKRVETEESARQEAILRDFDSKISQLLRRWDYKEAHLALDQVQVQQFLRGRKN